MKTRISLRALFLGALLGTAVAGCNQDASTGEPTVAPAEALDGRQLLAATTPWTSQFCNMYNEVPWAQTVRGPGAPALAAEGFDLVLPDGGLDLAALANLKAKVAERLDSGTVIVPMGSLGGSRDPDAIKRFIKFVSKDKGAAWRKIIEAQVRELSTLPGSNRIVWQLGNEINSECFARGMLAAVGVAPAPAGGDCDAGENGVIAANDERVIGPYVEYSVAPAVEAALAANPSARLMLGSVANAYNVKSRTWLNRLMSRNIEGTYAKTLAGQQVADVVDLLSYHYLVTGDVPGSAGANLDDIRTRWVGAGKGKVAGFWATEELGSRRVETGRGAAVTSRLVFQYLTYWQKNDVGPAQGRACFYGVNGTAPGGSDQTRGAYALDLIMGLFGDVSLDVKNNVSAVGTNLRSWAAGDGAGKLAMAVVATSDAPAALVSKLQLGNAFGGKSVEVHYLTPSGDAVKALKADAGGVVTLTSPLKLRAEDYASLLVLVGRSPAASP